MCIVVRRIVIFFEQLVKALGIRFDKSKFQVMQFLIAHIEGDGGGKAGPHLYDALRPKGSEHGVVHRSVAMVKPAVLGWCSGTMTLRTQAISALEVDKCELFLYPKVKRRTKFQLHLGSFNFWSDGEVMQSNSSRRMVQNPGSDRPSVSYSGLTRTPSGSTRTRVKFRVIDGKKNKKPYSRNTYPTCHTTSCTPA